VIAGPVDVVVCDGFVGNVLLKFYEAVAPILIGLEMAQRGGRPAAQIGSGELRMLDYSEYGGAPLLGVRGVSIICHGKSTPARHQERHPRRRARGGRRSMSSTSGGGCPRRGTEPAA
jgi:fatty acid/phospholipid biosynthesis enzyme